MPTYDSPTMSGIGFSFTTGGYSAPGMDEVGFRFGLRPSYQQTADLQAAINVLGLYQDSTYTYLKSCPTYVVGYGSGGIQIIKAPCIYGGVRDLGAYIYSNPEHTDLVASITGSVSGITLRAYVKAMGRSDNNFPAYLKQKDRDNNDLIAEVTSQLQRGTSDLAAYLQTIPPADLSAYLNVIEQIDLLANVQGELLKGQKDLLANIVKIYQRGSKDLGASVQSYAIANLLASIGVVYYQDLSAFIWGSEYSDLSGTIFGVGPLDLGGYIHGYAISDLSASLIGGFGPGDLRGRISAIEPRNLSALIYGFKGINIESDLKAFIDGFYTYDLNAYVYGNSPENLPAYLNAVGKTIDLNAVIYPMVIHLKKVLNIALLEHNNLWAVVNVGCFGSGYGELSAYLYPLMKSDLRANIIGWYGGYADNINDLRAYINVGDYYVEDRLLVKTIPFDKKSQLKVNIHDISGSFYKNFDTIRIKFGNFYAKYLGAYIYGLPEAKDLTASVNVLQQLPYREAPVYMKIKTREVVLNIQRFEPQWRRVAELFFDNFGGGDPFYYFYVQGENKVYRINRNKHWIIRAVGYTRAPSGHTINRQKIWKKYIVDMTRYKSIDEAVRDLVDRVTFLRRTGLAAYIRGVYPPYNDLSAYMGVKSYYHWYYHLKSHINVLQNSYSGLSCSLNVSSNNGSNSLGASINAQVVYQPVSGGSADFEFTTSDVGYVPPVYDKVDYEFNL